MAEEAARRVMILAKYQPNFESLEVDQAYYLAEAMHLPEKHALDGRAIFEVADEAGMDQADVVMTLAHDPSVMGVQVVEKLIGKPIVRAPRPVSRGAGGGVRRTTVVKPVLTATAYQLDSVISEVQDNPKKVGSSSHARYALYQVGMTVAQFLAAGGTKGDVKWDSERGFIKFATQEKSDD